MWGWAVPAAREANATGELGSGGSGGAAPAERAETRAEAMKTSPQLGQRSFALATGFSSVSFFLQPGHLTTCMEPPSTDLHLTLPAEGTQGRPRRAAPRPAGGLAVGGRTGIVAHPRRIRPAWSAGGRSALRRSPHVPVLAWSVIPPQAHGPYAFIILGGVAAMLISMAKSGFGSGIGLLAVPLMTLACGGDAPLATGIMLPLLIPCDWLSLVAWWRKWDWRQVISLLPGAAAGIAVGGAALWGMMRLAVGEGRDLSSASLKLAIGVISLGFVALQAARAWRGRALTFRPGRWHGAGFGAVAGVTSTLAHAAGPVTTMYLLPQGMPKGTFVATTVVFYWIINQFKLLPYVALGMIDRASLLASAALVPAVVAGTFLGLFLHRRVPQRPFTAVVYVLLALAGAHLTGTALAALWG
jgi:hypothetical protein